MRIKTLWPLRLPLCFGTSPKHISQPTHNCRYLSTTLTSNPSLEYSSRITCYLDNAQLQIKSTIDVMTDATETEHLDAHYPTSSNQTTGHICHPGYRWNLKQFRLQPGTRIPTHPLNMKCTAFTHRLLSHIQTSVSVSYSPPIPMVPQPSSSCPTHKLRPHINQL